MITMVRPAIAIYRWPGFGLDVRVFLGGRGPLFFAEDVCLVLNVAVPSESNRLTGRIDYSWPSGIVHHVDVQDDAGYPVPFYGVNEVRRIANDHPDFFTADFLTWFNSLVADLNGEGLARAIDNTIGEEPGLVESMNYSVAQAARILSADPHLSYGRESLFAAMNRLHWTERENNIWVPTKDALQSGFLIRQGVIIPFRKDLYPQIRITTTGLQQLHTRLGGIAALNLNPPAPLTLVEI